MNNEISLIDEKIEIMNMLENLYIQYGSIRDNDISKFEVGLFIRKLEIKLKGML